MEKNVKLNEIKSKVIEFLKVNGPGLPNEIAKKVNRPLLITSAILSEMTNEKLIKASNIKIGSSPLYFLEGQEEQLEKFETYLKGKEKEALNLLKKNKVLHNDGLDPSIRVALNNIKDFAKILKIKINDKVDIFWKYFLVKDNEVKEIIEKIMNKNKKHTLKKEAIKNEAKIDKEKGREVQKKIELERKEKSLEFEKKDLDNFEKYIKSNFSLVEKISNEYYIVSKEILDEIVDFLVIIKNKKRISESDILISLREGQERKMPVIILTKGKLTKKAKKIVDESGSFLIIRKFK